MKIILLSGKQGSGKTSIQDAIFRHPRWPVTVAKANFADVLYQMHNEVLKILHQYWPDRGLVKDGPLLQVLGTQWGRDTIDKDIWVKVMRAKIDKISKSPAHADIIVVGDCRFENEFDAFPEALRVRLYCPEATRKERCSMWRDNTEHPSETGLDLYYTKDKFDLTLNTEKMPVEECVEKIFEKLQTPWQRARKV